MDIHGQDEGRALMDPDQQRELLDAYGGLGDRVEAYRSARRDHEALRRQRQELIESAEARRRERALLEFERDELTAADPRRGESEELAPRPTGWRTPTSSAPRPRRATRCSTRRTARHRGC